MALVLKDRVRESSSSSGTGSITLAGAFTGYQTFASAVTSGSTVYYTIHNTSSPNDGEWEVGLGTFTAPSTLSRDTVLSSSTGGTKVSFSGSSVLDVFITQPAEEAVYVNTATGKVESNGNGSNTISFTNINTTNLTANTVTLTAGTITTNAANNTDIVNKQYVDGLVAAGIHFHEPVLVESPTALIATYNQPGGAGNGVGATLTNSGSNVALVIDGVTLSNTARVLVYTQSNAVQNGVYTVTDTGAPDAPGPGAAWVLTRATDADTYVIDSPTGLSEGSTFFVQSGNTGAGETYTCNTTGTITFGTTNITFAQISSAQIYSAGTGLSLTNTTFSISNTAVTAAQYGNDGAVGQFTVNAQGQLTNAANVSINASSISVGTLANGRTTAASANGASTIVLRDSNGDFAANTITATTSNATTFNGTTGAFTSVSGNGVALTAINASNVTSGTLDNARTTGNTANSASTIVLRDADGSFGANIVTATFSGNGATLSAINASNISSGTIANARTTAASANGASTIVQRDSGGNFAAATVTAAVIGDLSGGSSINASNVSSGTIANARTTAATANGASTIVLRGASGEFAAGAITGASFSGNGSALTAINASAITTGTIDNARTTGASANGASTLVLRDANGSFAGNVITGTNFSGGGSSITAINASALSSGTAPVARLAATGTPSASTFLRGDSAWVALSAPNNGTLTMNTSGTGLSGSATFTADQAGASTFTVASNATSANGASTLVARDASGNFTANAVTATNFIGGGASISAINGSNVTTGTVANARTTAASANGASTIVARDANGSFTANAITTTSISGNGVALTAINASNVTSGTLVVGQGGTGQTTLTAENVILGNGASAVKVVAPGTANNVLTSNGSTWISQAVAAGGTTIPAGTVMIFGQTAAPTGFTKLTDQDNAGLRVVSGTASTGGSVNFTTAFASQTPTGSVSISAVSGSAGATTLSTPQIPSHTHPITLHPGPGASSLVVDYGSLLPTVSATTSTGSTGGGGSHTHPFSFSSGSGTFSGNAINLAVKYVDVIRATKD